MKRPFYLMGILNVTPDSFYDGGRYVAPEDVARHAGELVDAGADILDIGGESTRPGAEPVSVEEELRRVIPVIAYLKRKINIPLSIDTTKAEVARRALEVGATLINDVSGGTMDERMMDLMAASGVTYVLTHIQGTPKNMQVNPLYQDVVREVLGFFEKQLEKARAAGVKREQLILDPGIGFGKTVEHHVALFRSLEAFGRFGLPVLMGASRKSFIGKLDGSERPEDRLSGSLAAAVWGYLHGATYFRVHDVLETRKALQVTSALYTGRVR